MVLVGLAAGSPSHAQSIPRPIGAEGFRVLRAFYDYDAEIPLEARVVELKDRDKSVRRKVVFRSSRGFLVPGYLEVPKTAKPPYRCVLLMHGWSGSKEHWWEKGNYISGGGARAALLDKGYAVFALDAQGHGDRIAENDYHVVNLHNEPGAPARKNYFTVREIIAQTVVDYRRGLDYLATRDDIDMQRIGLLGYSMGGFHAFALTAMEPRIRLAVGCVVPVSWSHDVVLAPANYAQGIGDRHFCMLMGREDKMCNETQARELYELIKTKNTTLLFYDAGHKLPASYVRDAVAFIASQL
jgi:dienelactone hydrolase